MAKIYDLEKERQKARGRAKGRAKELRPPIISFTSKDGNLRVYPRQERGPDGKWRIQNIEEVRAMLGYDQEETDKEEETKED